MKNRVFFPQAALDEWIADAGVRYRVEVATRPSGAPKFKPIKIRWVVEQSIACLNRYRRLSKDYEYLPESSTAMIELAMISLMLRRLAPP